MKFVNTFSLSLEDKADYYKNLLQEEDFDFKSKNIEVEINEGDSEGILNVCVLANSLHDLKIGVTAVLKSLEVISKTLDI